MIAIWLPHCPLTDLRVCRHYFIDSHLLAPLPGDDNQLSHCQIITSQFSHSILYASRLRNVHRLCPPLTVIVGETPRELKPLFSIQGPKLTFSGSCDAEIVVCRTSTVKCTIQYIMGHVHKLISLRALIRGTNEGTLPLPYVVECCEWEESPCSLPL
jgi:hypothetical protein